MYFDESLNSSVESNDSDANGWLILENKKYSCNLIRLRQNELSVVGDDNGVVDKNVVVDDNVVGDDNGVVDKNVVVDDNVVVDSEGVIIQQLEINTRARSIRKLVNKNQDKAANNMEKKHNKKRNKKTHEFKIGDAVSVLGGTDLPRMPGQIKRKPGDYYEIVTQYGILNNCLLAGDLEVYSGVLNFDCNKITYKISIREAARNFGKREKDLKYIEVSCDCKGKCKDKRCKSVPNSMKCNSHCQQKMPVAVRIKKFNFFSNIFSRTFKNYLDL
ncbi:unnamed protein product [Brachionus calyciflorus]|uniref:Uncharacterized protein n=1 Tax=Brachionus calyciflorus TaxID=104777 RepID=A0A814LE45_9BILA|nr:unnamed protein product [Brachionus calyciflorus]